MFQPVFDLDDTLALTQGFHSRNESFLLADYGIHMEPKDLSRRFSGVSGKDMWPTIFSEHFRKCPPVDELANDCFDMLMRTPRDEIKEVPGAVNVLANLWKRGKLIGVASGARLEWVELVLDVLRVRNWITATASSKEVEHGKPAPDLLYLIAKRMHIDPKRSAYIGDSIWDMRTAKAAGMLPIHLMHEELAEHEAPFVIRSMAEFPYDLM